MKADNAIDLVDVTKKFDEVTAVANFSVATTRNWVSADGERHEETEWFNVVAWGSLAEICSQYLHKGKRVYVEGRLQTRRWEDSEGKKQFTTELVAKEMIMLGEQREPEMVPLSATPDEEDTLSE